jgi:hypothetical protein
MLKINGKVFYAFLLVALIGVNPIIKLMILWRCTILFHPELCEKQYLGVECKIDFISNE